MSTSLNKKGDEVIVLAGKDKGKTGKIVKMFPKQRKPLFQILIKLKKLKPDNNQPGVLLIKKCHYIYLTFHFMIQKLKKGLKLVLR